MRYLLIAAVLSLPSLAHAQVQDQLPAPHPAISEPLSAPAPPQANSGARRPVPVKVVRVKDGDTMEIGMDEMNALGLSISVRVRRINAPEAHSSCGQTGGQIASRPRAEERALADLATTDARLLITESNNVVTLTNAEHDKFGGRILADVTLSDGRNFANTMIKRGHVDHYNGGKRTTWCGRAVNR